MIGRGAIAAVPIGAVALATVLHAAASRARDRRALGASDARHIRASGGDAVVLVAPEAGALVARAP